MFLFRKKTHQNKNKNKKKKTKIQHFEKTVTFYYYGKPITVFAVKAGMLKCFEFCIHKPPANSHASCPLERGLFTATAEQWSCRVER